MGEIVINFERAYSIAMKHFSAVDGSIVIKALETDDLWIFYGGIPNQVELGRRGIKVYKKSGAVEDFILPSPQNFAILVKATPIKL